jgi:hypothetical protein
MRETPPEPVIPRNIWSQDLSTLISYYLQKKKTKKKKEMLPNMIDSCSILQTFSIFRRSKSRASCV